MEQANQIVPFRLHPMYMALPSAFNAAPREARHRAEAETASSSMMHCTVISVAPGTQSDTCVTEILCSSECSCLQSRVVSDELP
jgi:hypothetical protein